MAARFWVGGSGTWSTTNTTNWSATSGGAGGASVPTAADDVTIDANSGSPTVTTNYNASVISVTINAAAATLSLGGTLTCSGAITLTAGTFTTNNFNVTATNLSSNNGNTRTINLGSSTVTLSAISGTINFNNNGGLTFNAGTSTIVCSGAGSNITSGSTGNSGNGVTFYNVSYTSTTASTHAVLSINTFNNITVTAPAAAGVTQVTFDSRTTINGTLSTTGTAGNRRVWFRGTTYGLAQTLTINSAPSLTDADFRDIYVIGTAAPISGTRIGDLRGCRGITFSTPKTVYWNRPAGGTWSDDAWATTSGGAVSTDNFPLAQDTAIIENTGLNTSAAVSTPSSGQFLAVGTLNASSRTLAMTLTLNVSTYYGDFTLGSGVTIAGSNISTFSGRNTQTITSAGKTFSAGITIDSYGGTVQLADALNIGGSTFNVTNGTFNTQNYAVTCGLFQSDSGNVRSVNFGASTVTLISNLVLTATNLSFSAGTSQINFSASFPSLSVFAGAVLHNVTRTTNSPGTTFAITSCTFNNLTIQTPNSEGPFFVDISGDLTINGTLTVAGSTAVRRVFVRSNTIGATRTLTANSLSAQDCDFRDITIAGAAAGSSPTRAGNCGGNTGITFPAPKTVYWNLAGSQNWSATAWATSSGGTPALNNFPLAQDTAVFDNAGTVGTVTVQTAWNIGTLNMSGRTNACTIDWSNSSPFIYGNVLLGSGVTPGTIGVSTLAGRGTQTITSSGQTWSGAMAVDCVSGTVQLADALTLIAARTLTLTSGTFDAVTYNVTTGLFNASAAVAGTVWRMGSGTWTLSGTGAVLAGISTNVTLFKGAANIVLSDTSTAARTFAGNGFSFNRLTIGGATGTSTLTITGNNQFTELASTKTVAHTIALGTTTQTFGAWTVTGTVGNVVTLTGTGTNHVLAGACTSGIDYLAMGSIGFAATSPGEFYAGANSTGTAAAPVYRTAKPADSTRFWVGGTGNWSDTARWSTSSGGAGGASIPRSHDDVVFNSASNATAYTATVNAVTGGIRCKALTIAGPASGNLTLAGSTAIDGIHGNVTLPATGLTRTYTGAITLSGSATGRTFTTNGVTLSSAITVNGVGCGWTLGSALDIGTQALTLTNGSFDLTTYNLTAGSINANNTNSRTINFGSGTTSLSGTTVINFGTTESERANLVVNAGTSQINLTRSNAYSFSGNNQTFYNVSVTSTSTAFAITLNGENTFNDLFVTGAASAGVKELSITANQTINGTLTLSAGTNATMRTFLRSDTIGTTRTLTCAAFSGTDADFRDITIAGVAAPVSGTRLGDCKGNSGITFPAPKTVYWRGGTGNWSSSSGWSDTDSTPGGTTFFPLAQDTATFITSPASGATVTLNAAYNIGTIDMSARTSNTMTLATSTNTPTIYGNWINGTGTTISGTSNPMTFAGRGSQTITSAGKTFTQIIAIDTPSGSVTLQDAFDMSGSGMQHRKGVFNANGYNVTFGASAGFNTNFSDVRTLAFGSGTWTFSGAGTVFTAATTTNLTVTGTGTISLTSASAKTFAGGGLSYSGITLNQGGAGTLTITGNNTFANITNSYKATGATTIAMGTTTQRVGNFTASGEAGRVLTVQGTSASSPATLVYTGTGQAAQPAIDYLAITGVRAYNLAETWYAGNNSTNNGSLGWYFEAGGGGPITVFIIENAIANSTEASLGTFNPTISELANSSDSVASGAVYIGALAESATAADVVAAIKLYLAEIAESATASDLLAASLTFAAAISELTTASDQTAVASRVTSPTIAEAAQMADSVAGGLFFLSNISESASPADVASAVLIFNRAVAESATASEIAVAIAAFRAAVSEEVSGADVANALITIGGAINEALTALDSVVGPKTTNPTIEETATASEAQTNVYTANPTIAELAQAFDAAQVVASTFSAASVESAVPLDAPQGANTGSSSLSESASGSDSSATAFVAPAAVSESTTAEDAAAALVVFNSPVVEAVRALDTSSVAPSVFSAVAAAVAAAFDLQNAPGSIYNVTLPTEGARASDSLIGAYLWNPIDDDQVANWAGIPTPQSPNWAGVDDTQNPNWQNVVNTQGSGWVQVNTDDTPNWQPTIEP